MGDWDLPDDEAGERPALVLERLRVPKPRDDSAERAFEFQCRQFRLPPVQRQYRIVSPFLKTPKTGKPATWVFDFAFPSHALLVEIDGGIFRPGGGAHSHPVDIRRNMLKQNDAVLLGWSILRFTPEQVKRKSMEAIGFTQRVLFPRGTSKDLNGQRDPVFQTASNPSQ